MADTQLRLLPPAQPLVERFGAGFFRSLPRRPGIYRFYDDNDRLLYVGKARDLRARLSSYRRTRGQSRKTIRLIHAARRVEWEICPDETAACLRENDWIRTHRPRFNRAGTWPRSARFVVLEVLPEGWRLRLSPDPEGECYGAFRGGVAFGLAALGRLLWWAWHGTAGVHALPLALGATGGLRHWETAHPSAAAWLPDLRRFLTGEDDGLVGRLVAAVPEPEGAFDRQFAAAQFEQLAWFFRSGPHRNRRLCRAFDVRDARLSGIELDDLTIRAGPAVAAPPFRPD